MDLKQAIFNMVEQQIRPWDVLDPKVLDLFMTVSRHKFVDPSQHKLAYSDIELPIIDSENSQQTMLFPKVEGRILQAVDAGEEDSVLEIGTGYGYLTALLASVSKTVTTVEFHQSIQDIAKKNLASFKNINYQIGDGATNWDDNNNYDVIVLGGASSKISADYKNKLKLGGRLFTTVGKNPVMVSQVLTRVSNTEWENETLFETVMPILINSEQEEQFSF
jgi:protein-L-isoaspartate(D-aspartate) O-methyltransferase